MFFWFKRKKLVLDCFTDNNSAYTHNKIDHASKFLPEWWKNLPKTIPLETVFLDNTPHKVRTMKSCKGFTDLYKNSFIMPFWENLIIESFEGNYRWFSSNTKDLIEHHHTDLFKGFIEDSKIKHLKIFSPWYLKTDKLVNFYFSDPLWNRSNVTDYAVLPGVINFKYNHGTHVNMVINANSNYSKFYINIGDPLVCLTPMTEEDIDIRHHLVTSKELTAIVPADPSLFDIRETKYNAWKKFIERKEASDSPSKCPYSRKNKDE